MGPAEPWHRLQISKFHAKLKVTTPVFIATSMSQLLIVVLLTQEKGQRKPPEESHNV
jgi:hypothetical protein